MLSSMVRAHGSQVKKEIVKQEIVKQEIVKEEIVKEEIEEEEIVEVATWDPYGGQLELE